MAIKEVEATRVSFPDEIVLGEIELVIQGKNNRDAERIAVELLPNRVRRKFFRRALRLSLFYRLEFEELAVAEGSRRSRVLVKLVKRAWIGVGIIRTIVTFATADYGQGLENLENFRDNVAPVVASAIDNARDKLSLEGKDIVIEFDEEWFRERDIGPAMRGRREEDEEDEED